MTAIKIWDARSVRSKINGTELSSKKMFDWRVELTNCTTRQQN